MEKKLKELQQACEDLKKEIGQRQLENKTLKEDLETSARQVTIDKKDYDKATEKMENLKVLFIHFSVCPWGQNLDPWILIENVNRLGS